MSVKLFHVGIKEYQECVLVKKRKLTCPPEYAYGDRGFGDIIPARSTLVFDIELLDIPEPAKEEKKADTPPPPKDIKKEVKEETVPEPEHHDHEGEHDHGDSFEAVDTDKNNEITRDEMAAYIKTYQAAEEGEEQPSDDEMETLISEIFQTDDTNKDGVLSKEEFYHSTGEFGNEGDLENEMEVDENDLKDEL